MLTSEMTSSLLRRDKRGFTALHWAAYKGHHKCVECLLEIPSLSSDDPEWKGNPFSPLHCAVANDHEPCCDVLFDSFENDIINAKDSKGRTPLHVAAFYNSPDCLQILLTKDVLINSQDDDRMTPLMMAAKAGHANVIKILLLSSGIEGPVLFETDLFGNTALHIACLEGHGNCALLLLEKSGVDAISIRNEEQQTPLHISAQKGLVMVVTELISLGADVCAVDQHEHTPALCCASTSDTSSLLRRVSSCSNRSGALDEM